jgi:hypothetical protein
LIIDILQLSGAWTVVEGFPQPDWRVIGDYVRRTYPEANQPEVWEEACIQWLGAVRHALDADAYHLFESKNFVLLTTKTPPNAKNALAICENALVQIRSHLGDLAWRWTNGKHAVIMFDDFDVYYRYISYFYPAEGDFSGSDATFLNRGYCLTAVGPIRGVTGTLVHELVHLCLAPKRIPKWVNEGLAINISNAITGLHSHAVNRDLVQEHEAYWTTETIQEFWRGKSFSNIDANRVSYSLAQILVGNMQNDYDKFYDFVKDANRSDAGEASALIHLGDSLGLIASVFLGPGDWTPRPPAP